MINSEWIYAVDEKNFSPKVVEMSKTVPVVVDFWAPWCQPCKLLKPMLESAIQNLNGQIMLAEINTDENPNLAASFKVEGIPAVFALKDGLVVNRFQGLLSEEQLQEFLATLLPTEVDKRLTEVVELIKTDPVAAEEAVRALFKKNPKHDKVRLILARILAGKGDEQSEVPGLLEPVGSEGDTGKEVQKIMAELKIYQITKNLPTENDILKQIELRPKDAMPYYHLGCLKAGSGKYEEALKLLIQAGENDINIAKNLVREAMVSIFHLVGVGSPLANQYRSKLSSLLY
ncbi:MAG: hypothetical protein EBT92_13935 [Planctomycetes bacterium]|nr:hypothetical protein [Planctomycetota bacterium]NBY02389.1 hypothetical protein [Planctomycetota bacterium]